MSVWWLVGVGVFAWMVVSVAFALWLGRLFSRKRRGGYVDLSLVTSESFRGANDWPITSVTVSHPSSFTSSGGNEAA